MSTLRPRITQGSGRTYALIVGLGVLVGALSLLRWTALTYDPWCWVTWGREILHGHLTLEGGPSWKPLPVIFTTVFALFGSAAPNLWVVVARAGLVVAALMIFRLAVRLTWKLACALLGDPETREARIATVAPAVVAGAIAAIAYLLGEEITRYSLLGDSEGLLTAAALIAVERAVDGHHRQAFAIGAITALDRPESWIVWMPYGAWLMWRDAGSRWLVLSILAGVVALWLVPERLGSPSFTSSISRATAKRQFIQKQPCPFCADVRSYIWPLLPKRLRYVSLIPLLAPIGVLIRVRMQGRNRHNLTGLERGLLAWGALSAIAVGWWLVIAVEAQAGFSGSVRYLMLGTAFMYISAGTAYGVGAGLVASAITRLGRPKRPVIALVGLACAAAAAAIFAFVPTSITSVSTKPSTVTFKMDYDNAMQTEIQGLIRQAGGAAHLRSCGQIIAEFYSVPMDSWYLNVPLDRIYVDPVSAKRRGLPAPVGPGKWPQVVVQDRSLPSTPLRPSQGTISRWQQIAGKPYHVYTAKEVTMYVNCR